MDKVSGDQWPFSRPELMAGLRRYLAAASLRLLTIDPMPLPDTMPGVISHDSGTTLSAFSVGVSIDGMAQTLPLMLKEPPVSYNGRVLRAVGQREYGVYRLLAPHLPLLVPGLVAGDETQGWLVLEVLTGLRPPIEWLAEDYTEALGHLVRLHDRFYGAGDVLVNYPWLARPLSTDYAATVNAAAEAVAMIGRSSLAAQVLTSADMALFDRLINLIDRVAAPLQAEPFTLIHGDYWPGNIARPIDGRQIVYDWQMAGIGPAVLDIVNFVQSSQMYLIPPLTVTQIIAIYRNQAAGLFAPAWDEVTFERLWAHGLLWMFTVKWLGRLATMPSKRYTMLAKQLREVWFAPVAQALQRYL